MPARACGWKPKHRDHAGSRIHLSASFPTRRTRQAPQQVQPTHPRHLAWQQCRAQKRGCLPRPTAAGSPWAVLCTHPRTRPGTCTETPAFFFRKTKTPSCPEQHVDHKIANALLKKGTREAYKMWTQQDRGNRFSGCRCLAARPAEQGVQRCPGRQQTWRWSCRRQRGV